MRNPCTALFRSAATAGGVAVLAAAVVTGCGSSDPEPAKITMEEFVQEYFDSTDVRNDPFEDYGDTPEDRKAALAAEGDAQQIVGALLSAYPCDAESAGALFDDLDVRCPGGGSTGFHRSVLVRHPDESLEVIPLHLTRPRGADLVDSTGARYTGGLDDFRRHNDLLDSDDLVLTVSNPDSTSGGRLVVTSGHTRSETDRTPWLVGGGAGALLAAGAVALVVRRRTHT